MRWTVSLSAPVTAIAVLFLMPTVARATECAETESSLGALVGQVATADEPRLPDCASPLMQKIFAGAKSSFADKGTLAAQYMATGNNVARQETYVGTDKIFPAIAEFIEETKEDLTYQTYQFEPDSWAGATVLDGVKRLHEKAKAEGRRVHVRLLADASSIGMGTGDREAQATELMKALAARGLRLHLPGFPPVTSGVQFEFSLAKHHSQTTYHAKTLTRDGLDAIVTGANTHHYWGQTNDGAFEAWYDVAYRFVGEVAPALRSEFNDAWTKAGQWACRDAGGTFDKCVQDPAPLQVLPGKSIATEGCLPVIVVGSDMRRSSIVNHAISSLEADLLRNPLNDAMLAALANAGEVVRMQTPIFNATVAVDAVKETLARGVPVEMVLSKDYQNWQKHIPFQGGNSHTTITELYRYLREDLGLSPIESCKRLQVRWFSADGIRPTEGKEMGQAHHKYYSFDHKIVAVGSMNMDHQSWYHAREILTFVDSEETTREWDRQVFEANFNRGISVAECDPNAAPDEKR